MLGPGGDDVNCGAVAEIVVEGIFGRGQDDIAAAFDLEFAVAGGW